LNFNDIAEYSNYQTGLNVFKVFKQKVFTIAPTITFLSKSFPTFEKFISHPQFPKVKEFLLNNATYHSDTWVPLKNSTFEDVATWAYVFETLCRLSPQSCKEKADQLFSEWKSYPKTSSASPLDNLYKESRPIWQCAIVANGGQEAYDFILAKYRQSIKNGESLDSAREYLIPLACAEDKVVFEKFLKLILTTESPPDVEGIEGYNRRFIESHVLETPLASGGRNFMFEFISKNFDAIDKQLGYNGESAVPAMVSSLTRSWQFTTREQKKEIQRLFKLHEKKLKRPNNAIIVPRVYQELDKNIEWMENQGKDVLISLQQFI